MKDTVRIHLTIDVPQEEIRKYLMLMSSKLTSKNIQDILSREEITVNLDEFNKDNRFDKNEIYESKQRMVIIATSHLLTSDKL